MKTILIALLPIAICACNGHAKPSDKKAAFVEPIDTPTISAKEMRYYKASVGEFVDSTFGRGRFNGCILVAKNGEIIYEKYSGFRNPRVAKDSITASTPFHLASVSKTFTAMAIMKLQEEGKLKIQDPVSQYLPQFPLTDVT
ncbi:MAG: beta-lactamase family protein, partial [Chitinophagaceae bacterium]|nr:beta-lactamase family protein [Chitinophagaceae bacterium]